MSMIIGAVCGNWSKGSVGTSIRRRGSTGRSMPTILATLAAQAPAQFTIVRVEIVSRVVMTSKALPLRLMLVTGALFHNFAPRSDAQLMKPTMVLLGSTNPSVEQKL